jgi:hypothetical protein
MTVSTTYLPQNVAPNHDKDPPPTAACGRNQRASVRPGGLCGSSGRSLRYQRDLVFVSSVTGRPSRP